MNSDIFKELKKDFPKIKKNILLKNYTTFKIGGPAEYFLEANNKEEVLKAVKLAKKIKLPIFVLGGGSNLLVSDNGFKGLVIKLNNTKIELLNNNIISADAGVQFGKLVDFSIKNSLEGLEWAGGLPGSFGGAVRGNAGAFGGETKDSIIEVQALDSKFNFKKFNNKQSQFSYRNSIFKKNNWPVVSAKIKLKEGDKKKLKEIADSMKDYRKQKHPLEFPNAGSIFKNVDLNQFSEKMKKDLSFIVKKDPFPVVPTAYLISESGLKGTKVGKAQVSEKHPNFIVNIGGATAVDVIKLIAIIKNKVKDKYNVNLETEVQFIGN